MFGKQCTVDSDQLADKDLHCFMQKVMSMKYIELLQ